MTKTKKLTLHLDVHEDMPTDVLPLMTLMVTAPLPLSENKPPMVMLSFHGQLDGDSVLLKWAMGLGMDSLHQAYAQVETMPQVGPLDVKKGDA